MGLEYNLEIASGSTPERVMQVIADKLGCAANDPRLQQRSRGINLNLQGLIIAVTAIREQSLGQVVIEEDYGFRPTIYIGFQLFTETDVDADYEAGMRAMMRATMAVLQHESGDAVLLFNGERTVLQRMSGKLQLNENWDNWTAHARLLPEVTLPYELCFVASPALEEAVPTTP